MEMTPKNPSLQIRQEAIALQDTLGELARWEKEMKLKDCEQMRSKKDKVQNSSSRKTSETMQVKEGKDHSKHMYDRGYGRWEKLKVTSEGDIEGEEVSLTEEDEASCNVKPSDELMSVQRSTESHLLTEPLTFEPANADLRLCQQEKEIAKKLFSQRKYVQAKRHYKAALKYAVTDYTILSNIALVHLKLKRYPKVEVYCNRALAALASIMKDRKLLVKTLLRRGTARLQQGYLRAAYGDVSLALVLEPNNAESKKLKRKAAVMIAKSIRRLPTFEISIRTSNTG